VVVRRRRRLVTKHLAVLRNINQTLRGTLDANGACRIRLSATSRRAR
jgi:hypothetical protein